MKKPRRFISRAYEWCAAKCRALLGAFDFLLPSTTVADGHPKRRGGVRLALLVMSLFLFACPVIFRPSCYATTFTSSDFTYTGSHTWVPEGGVNFSLRFLTGGTFIPLKTIRLDIFLVGGGGGGGTYTNNSRLGAGGGGGYAETYPAVTLFAGVAYTITIGGGGAIGAAGGTTSIVGTGVSYSKAGGAAGGNSSTTATGGAGGSGGGTGSNINSAGIRNGGSNGGNGAGTAGGTGQGTTTYEFGESSRTLYAPGGGGGCWNYTGGTGGAVGGGNGASGNTAATAGGVNTGGGGGGRADAAAAAGGSGIAIIRNAR